MSRIWLKINPHVVTLNPNGKTGSAVSLFGKLIYRCRGRGKSRLEVASTM